MGWDNDVGWIPPSSYATPSNQGFGTERNLFSIMNFWDLAWKQNYFLPWLKRYRDLFYSWCYHNQEKERSKEKLSKVKFCKNRYHEFCWFQEYWNSLIPWFSNKWIVCRSDIFCSKISYIITKLQKHYAL